MRTTQSFSFTRRGQLFLLSSILLLLVTKVVYGQIQYPTPLKIQRYNATVNKPSKYLGNKYLQFIMTAPAEDQYSESVVSTAATGVALVASDNAAGTSFSLYAYIPEIKEMTQTMYNFVDGDDSYTYWTGTSAQFYDIRGTYYAFYEQLVLKYINARDVDEYCPSTQFAQNCRGGGQYCRGGDFQLKNYAGRFLAIPTKDDRVPKGYLSGQFCYKALEQIGPFTAGTCLPGKACCYFQHYDNKLVLSDQKAGFGYTCEGTVGFFARSTNIDEQYFEVYAGQTGFFPSVNQVYQNTRRHLFTYSDGTKIYVREFNQRINPPVYETDFSRAIPVGIANAALTVTLASIWYYGRGYYNFVAFLGEKNGGQSMYFFYDFASMYLTIDPQEYDYNLEVAATDLQGRSLVVQGLDNKVPQCMYFFRYNATFDSINGTAVPGFTLEQMVPNILNERQTVVMDERGTTLAFANDTTVVVYLRPSNLSYWPSMPTVVLRNPAKVSDTVSNIGNFGHHIALSGDGLVLAVSAPTYNNNQGIIYFYKRPATGSFGRNPFYTQTAPSENDKYCGYRIAISLALPIRTMFAFTCGDGAEVEEPTLYSMALPTLPAPLPVGGVSLPACGCGNLPSGHTCAVNTTNCEDTPLFMRGRRNITSTDPHNTMLMFDYTRPVDWPISRYPMYTVPNIVVDISGTLLDFTYNSGQSNLPNGKVVYGAQLPLTLTGGTSITIYYIVWFRTRTSSTVRSPFAVKINEGGWFQGGNKLLERNAPLTTYIYLAGSTADFTVYHRFENSTGGGLEDYVKTLPGWNTATSSIQASATYDYSFLKCGIGTYQIGENCLECPPQTYQVNKYTYADSVTGQHPCVSCSCGKCGDCSITTGSCTLYEGYCRIGGQCYEQYERQNFTQNQCFLCDPSMNPTAFTNMDSTEFSCDDGKSCTFNDSCQNGKCTGTPVVCLNQEVTNNLRQNCEVCDPESDTGCSPAQDFDGCVFVNETTQERSCGCSIGGECYNDGTINPLNNCEYCDILNATDSWSFRGPLTCDDGDSCTFGDVCQPSIGCAGTAYSCSTEGECLIANECDGQGGCNTTYVPKGTMCREGDYVCSPNWYCDGKNSFCPPEPNLLPLVTLGNISFPIEPVSFPSQQIPTHFRAREMNDGLPYNSKVRVQMDNYRVGCGILNFSLAWYLDKDLSIGCNGRYADSSDVGTLVRGEHFSVPVLGNETTPVRTVIGPAVYSAYLVSKENIVQTNAYMHVLVKVTNSFNEVFTECQGPFIIDPTPPVPFGIVRILDTGTMLTEGTVYDDGMSSRFAIPSDYVAFSWTEFYEDNALAMYNGKTLRYAYAIGTAPGDNDIVRFTGVGRGSQIVLTDPTTVPLPIGVSLYVTVRGSNKAGLTATTTSLAFMLDPYVPTGCQLFDGKETLEGTTEPVQTGFVRREDTLIYATLVGCQPTPSGIASITVCFGTERGNCNLSPATEPERIYGTYNNDTSALMYQAMAMAPDGITYEHAVPVYATARLVTGAGKELIIGSSGAVLDTTPPQNLRVLLPTFSSTLSSLTVKLNFEELESLIVTATVSIRAGNSPLGPFVLSPRALNGQRNGIDFSSKFTIENLNLEQGKTYTVCFVITNIVGYASDEACATTTIDTEPPVFNGIVTDHDPANVAGEPVIAHTGTSIVAKWSPATGGVSGLIGYLVRVTTNGYVLPAGGPLLNQGPGEVEVLPWTNMDLVTTVSFASYFTAVEGYTYYVSVRPVSGAGLSVTRTSAGVVISRTPPQSTFIRVPHAVDTTLFTTSWWPYLTTLSFDVSSIGDKYAGMKDYEYSIGSCVSDTDAPVVPWTSIGNMSSASITSPVHTTTTTFILSDATTYCVYLKGVTNLNTVVSNVSRPFTIDTNIPVIGTIADTAAVERNDGTFLVYDGINSVDLDGSRNISRTNTTVLGMAWKSYTATPSGILGYRACFGTLPGVCDLSPAVWIRTTATSGTHGANLQLPGELARVFSTVTAVTGSGLAITSSSDGITFDPYPPRVDTLLYSLGTKLTGSDITVTQFQPVLPLNDGTVRNIAYNAPVNDEAIGAVILPSIYTVAAPIDYITVDIGTTIGGKDIINNYNGGSESSIPIPSFTLGKNGKGYLACATVTAVSTNGLFHRYVAPGCVRYDSTVPKLFNVTIAASGTSPSYYLPGSMNELAVKAGSVVSLCINNYGDDITGIAETYLEIGTIDGGMQYTGGRILIPSFSNIANSLVTTTATCANVTLPSSLQRGLRHIATLTMHDRSGKSVSVSTAPFTVIDEENPAGVLVSYVNTTVPSIDTVHSNLKIQRAVILSGSRGTGFGNTDTLSFVFVSSGSVTEFWASIGSAPDASNVRAWTRLTSLTNTSENGIVYYTATLADLTIGSGRSYLNILALDPVGRAIALANNRSIHSSLTQHAGSTSLTSATVLLRDPSPAVFPSRPIIASSTMTGKAVTSIADASRITVTWPHAITSFSEIAYYNVSISDTVNGNRLSDWIFVGLRRSYTFIDIPMTNVVSFYVTVMAVTTTQMVSEINSANITIDTSSPTIASNGTVIFVPDIATILNRTATVWESPFSITPSIPVDRMELAMDHISGMTTGIFTVAWRGVGDDSPSHSLVYEIALGMSIGSGDVVPFRRVAPITVTSDSGTSHMRAQIEATVSNSIALFPTLRVTDGAGNMLIHAGTSPSIVVTVRPNPVGFTAVLQGNRFRSETVTNIAVAITPPGGITVPEALAITQDDTANPFIPTGIAEITYTIFNVTENRRTGERVFLSTRSIANVTFNRSSIIASSGNTLRQFILTAIGVRLLPNTSYLVRTTLFARSGLNVSFDTVPFFVDNTAPVQKINSTFTHRSGIAPTVPLDVTWRNDMFTDPETGIGYYEIRLVRVSSNTTTATVLSILQNWTTIGSSTYYRFGNFSSIVGNHFYRIELRACNRANNCTVYNGPAPYIKGDTTPPVKMVSTATLYISGHRVDTQNITAYRTNSTTGGNPQLDYLTDCTRLQVTYPAYREDNANIDTYIVTLGTSFEGAQVAVARETGPSIVGTVNNIKIDDGMLIYAKAWVRNTAGLITYVGSTSVPVTCGSSYPSSFKVYDGYVYSNDEAGIALPNTTYRYQPYDSMNILGCHWSESNVPIAGLSHYVVSYGITKGGTEILPPTNVGLQRYFHFNGTFMKKGIPNLTRYCNVTAVSHSGLTKSFVSPGAKVDTSAPVPQGRSLTVGMDAPKVSPQISSIDENESFDGMVRSAISQKNSTHFKVCWANPFKDKESPIIRYDIAIREYKDALTHDSIGVTSRSPTPIGCTWIKNLTLQSGRYYVAYMYATNEAGLWSRGVRSVGIYIDATPPPVSTVMTNFSALVEVYQDAREANGLSRYGYLSSRNVHLELLSMMNDSITTITANGDDDNDDNSTSLTNYVPFPSSAVWRPVLNANVRLTADPVFSHDGETCPFVSRPLEITGFIPDINADQPGNTEGWNVLYRDPIVTKGTHVTKCQAGSFRSVFGVCQICPPGTFKGKDEPEDTPCRICGSGTFWKVYHDQIGNYDNDAFFLMYSTNTSAATECACLDYTTQVFDAESGTCVCGPGRYAPKDIMKAAGDLTYELPPEKPDGMVQGARNTEGLCTLCPGNLYKPTVSDRSDQCIACPNQGLVPNAEKSECMCSDTSLAYNPATQQCECAPGYYFDTKTNACMYCPGNKQYKNEIGNDFSLCKRCPFGTITDGDTHTTCILDGSIPNAAYNHDDYITKKKGAYCPAGFTHKYHGMRKDTIPGAAFEYWNILLRGRDPYSYDASFCIRTGEDIATRMLNLTLPGSKQQGKNVYLVNPGDETFFYKGSYMKTMNLPDYFPEEMSLDPFDQSFDWRAIDLIRSQPYAKVFAEAVTRQRWYYENIRGKVFSSAAASPAYAPSYEWNGYMDALFEKALQTPETGLISPYFDFITVNWREYRNNRKVLDNLLGPYIDAAKAALQIGLYYYPEHAFTPFVVRGQIAVNAWSTLQPTLKDMQDKIKDNEYIEFGGVLESWPKTYAYRAPFNFFQYPTEIVAWTNYGGKTFRTVTPIPHKFHQIEDGLYRMTFPGKDSWCNFTVYVPVHSCEPCSNGLVNPFEIPLSDTNANDVSNSDYRRNEGSCVACPSGNEVSAKLETSTAGNLINVFLTSNLRALHLDWSGIFGPDADSGTASYRYALGTTAGGVQLLPFTTVSVNTTRVTIRNPVRRLKLQPATPIFLTVVAIDKLGNSRSYLDTNPVVWSPVGPIPGRAKDSTLDRYVPPSEQVISPAPEPRNVTVTRSNGEDFYDEERRLTVRTRTPDERKHRSRLLATEEEQSYLSKRKNIRSSTLALKKHAVHDPMSHSPHGAVPSADKCKGKLMCLHHNMYASVIGEDLYTVSLTKESMEHQRRYRALGTRTNEYGRRLQYGTLPTGSMGTTDDDNNASSTTNIPYNWRFDTTLTDITFVRDAKFQSVCDTINITFEAFSDPTGITAYAGCVGTQPLTCNLMEAQLLNDVRTDVSTAQSVTFRNLDLPRSKLIFGTIHALSGAGQVASVSTSGILCEDRPPSTDYAFVYDTGRSLWSPKAIPGASGFSALGGAIPVDIDCDSTTNGIGAAWRDFRFTISLDHYEWSVGTAPGRTDILDWTKVGVSTSVYNSSLYVEPGTVVYANVMAIDRSGQSGMVSSDGVLILPDIDTINAVNVTTSSVDGENSNTTTITPIVTTKGTFVCHGSPQFHEQVTSSSHPPPSSSSSTPHGLQIVVNSKGGL